MNKVEIVLMVLGAVGTLSLIVNAAYYAQGAERRAKAKAEAQDKITLKALAQAMDIDYNPICTVTDSFGLTYLSGDRRHTKEYLCREIVRKGAPLAEDKPVVSRDEKGIFFNPPSTSSYNLYGSFVAAEACRAGDVVRVTTAGTVAPTRPKRVRKAPVRR
jgi:hypothetical protein